MITVVAGLRAGGPPGCRVWLWLLLWRWLPALAFRAPGGRSPQLQGLALASALALALAAGFGFGFGFGSIVGHAHVFDCMISIQSDFYSI